MGAALLEGKVRDEEGKAMKGMDAVDEIIARVGMWSGREVLHEPLSGGITNHNYLCRVDGKKYVLRVPGTGTDIFIDRETERRNAVASSKAGVSPEVLWVVEPEGAMVIPFVEGEVMHRKLIADDDARVVGIVEAIRQVHRSAVFDSDSDVFRMIRRYIRMAEDVKAFFPHDFQWMLATLERIETAMERDKPAPAACHNDLLSENFIVDATGKVWVLDWEYGGMNDPYFDLGDFAVEHPLSREQLQLVIRTYCGEDAPHRFCRMMLHRLTADLWWSQWAMIQDRLSSIDFDFYAYGLERYARFRENYYDRDFESWVKGV